MLSLETEPFPTSAQKNERVKPSTLKGATLARLLRSYAAIPFPFLCTLDFSPLNLVISIPTLPNLPLKTQHSFFTHTKLRYKPIQFHRAQVYEYLIGSVYLYIYIMMMMMRSFCGSLERCFGGFGGGSDCLLWHSDLKPHASGDFSIAVVQANSSLEDQSQVFTSPSATYVGVYDGHGGPEASRFVNKRLFPYLQKFSAENGGLSVDAIKKAFHAIEEDFLSLVKQSLHTSPRIASVGSCCLLGAISDNVLYVANLGDSRVVLGRRDLGGDKHPVVAQRLSTDHNVSVEEVRREVKSLHPDDEHIVVFSRGTWRIKGIIQVSRSIGDVYLKNPDCCSSPIPLKRPVMTAEPSVIVRELESQDLFLIFASDGLWEQLTDEEAVEIVYKYPRAGIARRLVRAALESAAKKREMRYKDMKKINRGVRRLFHDDITVIVVYLDHRKVKKNAVCSISAPMDIFSLNSDETEQGIFRTVA